MGTQRLGPGRQERFLGSSTQVYLNLHEHRKSWENPGCYGGVLSVITGSKNPYKFLKNWLFAFFKNVRRDWDLPSPQGGRRIGQTVHLWGLRKGEEEQGGIVLMALFLQDPPHFLHCSQGRGQSRAPLVGTGMGPHSRCHWCSRGQCSGSPKSDCGPCGGAGSLMVGTMSGHW